MNDDKLVEALFERDRILVAMDVEAARAFIAKHGGFVASRALDWTRILHLARFEVRTVAHELTTDSQIYLAKTGAQSVMMLPSASPYLRSAMDLIFPKDLFDAHMAASKAVPS